MAIVLTQLGGSLRKWGTETVVLASHEKLVVKTGPAPALVDMLNEKVPAGKVWSVTVGITIDET